MDAIVNARFYGAKPYQAAVIHGGPGALGTVAAIARELSKDYGVMEPLQTKNSIAELLQELDDIISATCDGPISLIGHSWGAWLGFIYAAEYSEKVKKLILVGSGPFEIEYVAEIDQNRMKHLTQPEITQYYALLTALDAEETKNKDQLMQQLGGLVEKADNFCAVEIETDHDECFPVCGDMYSTIWAEASELREKGKLLALADKITCPVVIIHGEHDPHPLDGVRVPLEKRIKDLRIHSLKKCGHNPWKEKYARALFYEILRKEMG
ncbi:MAG TPA: alpha/beta hydrolase [Firmicutes bacterium]|jgi:pimeloyl-ACP methyl ester carboxylesterase|nr:alpha/beta hydrolase [Bacillota bacterium]